MRELFQFLHADKYGISVHIFYDDLAIVFRALILRMMVLNLMVCLSQKKGCKTRPTKTRCLEVSLSGKIERKDQDQDDDDGYQLK